MGAWIAIGGTAITIVVNMVFLPKIGVMASAWASLACYTFMCITSYLQGQKHYPIPYKTLRIFGWIVAALLVYGVMEVVRKFTGENMFIILGVNTLLLLAFAFILFRVERDLFVQIMKRK